MKMNFPENAMWKWICLLVLLFATACSKDELLEKISSKEEQAHAKEVIHHLRAGEFEAIETALDPAIRSKDIRQTLVQLRALIPLGKPNSAKLVGANVSTINGATFHESVFEYNFGDKWLLISVNFKRQDNVETIFALSVNREPHKYDEKDSENSNKAAVISADDLQSIASPAEQAHAKELIRQLRDGEFAAIEKAFDSSQHVDNLHQILVDMRAMIPVGAPDSVKLTGAHFDSIDGARIMQTAYEYKFGSQVLVISVSFKRKDGVEAIYEFHVLPKER